MTVLGPNLKDIHWTTMKNQHEEYLLIGDYGDVTFAEMFNPKVPFSEYLAKRAIKRAVRLLHSRHWIEDSLIEHQNIEE